MKIGQIYFEGDSAVSAVSHKMLKFGGDIRCLTPRTHQESVGLNYILTALPGKLNRRAPSVVAFFNTEERRHYFMPSMISFDFVPVGIICDPAPRYAEVLLEQTEAVYSPLLKASGDPERAIDCFFKYWDISPHLEPKDLKRHIFAIAARWSAWEQLDLSWAERAASLYTDGIVFNSSDGNMNIDALEKLCRRQGLKKGTI